MSYWNETACYLATAGTQGFVKISAKPRSGVPPSSLAVDLLSDSEFLLYKLPKTS